MNLEAFQLGVDTVGPLVGATASLLARIFDGSIHLAQAKAELAGILSVATERLNKADVDFATRDKAETERIRVARKLHDDNK